MRKNDNTPTPIAVTRRQLENDKLRKNQRSQMNNHRIQTRDSNYNHAISAVQDSYMKTALMKVRENDQITHDESLTRINGTWLYNETLKN